MTLLVTYLAAEIVLFVLDFGIMLIFFPVFWISLMFPELLRMSMVRLE